MNPNSKPVSFFLDTASIDDITYWKEFGLVDGVTTNPALLAKEGCDPLEQLTKITKIVQGPVSAEVTSTKADEMIRQGMRLSKIAPNIVIKVPALPEGYKAARELKKKNVKLNITLTFHPVQAIPFILLGADYISLIMGRVEDFGLNSQGLVSEMKDTITALGGKSKLLTASLRNPNHVLVAVNGGSDVLTVPPSTWKNIFDNPLSTKGESDFMVAWAQLSPKMRKKYEDLAK